MVRLIRKWVLLRRRSSSRLLGDRIGVWIGGGALLCWTDEYCIISVTTAVMEFRRAWNCYKP
jgi:hypothetical protein